MSSKEIKVPDIGADQAEVIEIYIKVGDQLAVEDPVIALESDKASVDVPAPEAGVVKEILVNIGDRVSEGMAMFSLDTAETAESQSAQVDPVATAAAPQQQSEKPQESVQQPEQLITLPDIGADSATVIEVMVAVGDEVKEEESLIALESDKASTELPAPASGIVKEILVAVDDQVSEGAAIIKLALTTTTAAADQVKSDVKEVDAAKAAPVASTTPVNQALTFNEAVIDANAAKVHAGPAVRKLAREFGVDLTQVPGSGPNQRIVKEDVQKFVKQSLSTRGGNAAGFQAMTIELPDFSQFGEITRRSMDKVHRVTAENMLKSWLTVPHVTQFEEADITELEAFRKANKALAEQKGLKLTPVPFLLKACAYAMSEMPQFNVALDMEKYEVVEKSYIHIGVAVDTPDGLMVPVIRDVDKKGIWELSQELGDIAQRAKERKLKSNEMKGGCFTISSLGGIGGHAFTPIVNTPEVAILGVSKAGMKPVWNGSDFEPRLMLPLCLSYDHRAVNGADAARFTGLLGSLLGDLRQMLL